jgi:hypothetical protein
MLTFREEFLKLALEFADVTEKAFERNSEKSEMSKNIKISRQLRTKLDSICQKAKKDEILYQIEGFMSHDNKYIRCLAAMYSLFTFPELAEKILEELMDLPKPNAVGAQAFTILEVWRKGLMNL